MMVKSGLDFFILKSYMPLQRYLLTLPGQFSHYGQIVLHWAAATLKGLGEFQDKVLDQFLTLFLSATMSISTLPVKFWTLAISNSGRLGVSLKGHIGFQNKKF